MQFVIILFNLITVVGSTTVFIQSVNTLASVGQTQSIQLRNVLVLK